MTVKQVNQDPVNQVAKKRLEAEGEFPDPREVHLLQLALVGAVQADLPHSQVENLAGVVEAPKFYQILQATGQVTPEDLEEMPLEELAEQAISTLEGEQSQRQE